MILLLITLGVINSAILQEAYDDASSLYEFDKYINKIDIQNQSNNSMHLSKHLFIVVMNLLKRAKRNDLSKLTFKNLTK